MKPQVKSTVISVATYQKVFDGIVPVRPAMLWCPLSWENFHVGSFPGCVFVS